MIEDTRSPLAVSPAEFRGHLEAIARSGAKVLPVSRLSDESESASASDAFAITFDDGYASVARFAAPVLRDFGFPFAVFVVTSRVGRDNSWPAQPSWVPRRPLLDWGQIEGLAAIGADIGSHTVSHPDLTRLSRSEVDSEMEHSRREIETRLGRAPVVFAYPGGRVDEASRAIAGRLFSASFGTRHARMRARDDRAELPRVEICYFRSVRRFRRLFSPSIDVRLAARRGLRALRSAL
ncbi:MAG: polysaccharide deacetylase family protein [Thermoanaerobaculia bacterium]